MLGRTRSAARQPVATIDNSNPSSPSNLDSPLSSLPVAPYPTFARLEEVPHGVQETQPADIPPPTEMVPDEQSLDSLSIPDIHAMTEALATAYFAVPLLQTTSQSFEATVENNISLQQELSWLPPTTFTFETTPPATGYIHEEYTLPLLTDTELMAAIQNFDEIMNSSPLFTLPASSMALPALTLPSFESLGNGYPLPSQAVAFPSDRLLYPLGEIALDTTRPNVNFFPSLNASIEREVQSLDGFQTESSSLQIGPVDDLWAAIYSDGPLDPIQQYQTDGPSYLSTNASVLSLPSFLSNSQDLSHSSIMSSPLEYGEQAGAMDLANLDDVIQDLVLLPMGSLANLITPRRSSSEAFDGDDEDFTLGPRKRVRLGEAMDICPPNVEDASQQALGRGERTAERQRFEKSRKKGRTPDQVVRDGYIQYELNRRISLHFQDSLNVDLPMAGICQPIVQSDVVSPSADQTFFSSYEPMEIVQAQSPPSPTVGPEALSLEVQYQLLQDIRQQLRSGLRRTDTLPRLQKDGTFLTDPRRLSKRERLLLDQTHNRNRDEISQLGSLHHF